jgi:hypothetical protein
MVENGETIALCHAMDALWMQTLAAVRELPPRKRELLFELSHLQKTGATNGASAAALAIASGALGAAARRAFPAPLPSTSSQAVQIRGVYHPNPILVARVRDAVDQLKDPPCTGGPDKSSKASGGSSDLGEAGVQAALEKLASGGTVEEILGSALAEMFRTRFCEKLDELVEQLKRLANTVKDPATLERLVATQARIEHIHLPPTTDAGYRSLRIRALRAYAVEPAMFELELDSGGPIAQRATAQAAQILGPAPTDELEKAQSDANAEIEDSGR